jgi:hypothetical protein
MFSGGMAFRPSGNGHLCPVELLTRSIPNLPLKRSSGSPITAPEIVDIEAVTVSHRLNTKQKS